MGRGTIYPFVKEHLSENIRRRIFVLETGCGGALYRPIVESLGATYIGTDIFNEHYQEVGDVDLFCSSDYLPFKDNSLDIVFNQGAIDYMPNIEQTLVEIYRVLRPGGKLLIYTYRYDVLVTIHNNCQKTKRKWELSHHVFTSEQMLGYLKTVGFMARDITNRMSAWRPRAWGLALVKALGLYHFFYRRRCIWLTFEAFKPQ